MEYMVNNDPGKMLAIGNGPVLIRLFPRGSAAMSTTSSSIKYQSIQIPVDDASEANIHFCNAYEDGTQIIIDV
jgi:hypothetical protein